MSYPAWPPTYPPTWILIEVVDGKTRYTKLVEKTPETEKLKVPDPTRWR